MDHEEVRKMYRGHLRRRVLTTLESPNTATNIAKALKSHRSTVSQVLIDLENQGYVECLDKKEPYNRFYKRTKKGNEMSTELSKISSK